MEFLSSSLVGKPVNILLIGLVFLAGYTLLRFSSFGAERRPNALLIAAIGWAAYAAWEALVRAQTPEANIRVDLLIIWPIIALVSVWALFRAFR